MDVAAAIHARGVAALTGGRPEHPGPLLGPAAVVLSRKDPGVRALSVRVAHDVDAAAAIHAHGLSKVPAVPSELPGSISRRHCRRTSSRRLPSSCRCCSGSDRGRPPCSRLCRRCRCHPRSRIVLCPWGPIRTDGSTARPRCRRTSARRRPGPPRWSAPAGRRWCSRQIDVAAAVDATDCPYRRPPTRTDGSTARCRCASYFLTKVSTPAALLWPGRTPAVVPRPGRRHQSGPRPRTHRSRSSAVPN